MIIRISIKNVNSYRSPNYCNGKLFISTIYLRSFINFKGFPKCFASCVSILFMHSASVPDLTFTFTSWGSTWTVMRLSLSESIKRRRMIVWHFSCFKYLWYVGFTRTVIHCFSSLWMVSINWLILPTPSPPTLSTICQTRQSVISLHLSTMSKSSIALSVYHSCFEYKIKKGSVMLPPSLGMPWCRIQSHEQHAPDNGE